MHSPHDGLPPERATGHVAPPPIAPEPLWDLPEGRTLGVGGLPHGTGLKNVLLASRQVLPGLGLEGELAAGWGAARLILQKERKRDLVKGAVLEGCRPNAVHLAPLVGAKKEPRSYAVRQNSPAASAYGQPTARAIADDGPWSHCRTGPLPELRAAATSAPPAPLAAALSRPRGLFEHGEAWCATSRGRARR